MMQTIIVFGVVGSWIAIGSFLGMLVALSQRCAGFDHADRLIIVIVGAAFWPVIGPAMLGTLAGWRLMRPKPEKPLPPAPKEPLNTQGEYR